MIRQHGTHQGVRQWQRQGNHEIILFISRLNPVRGVNGEMPIRDQSARQPEVRFVAGLLAGGRSTRMGKDKCLLNIGSAPLWKRQLELLESITGRVGVVAPARPAWLDEPIEWIPDSRTGAGPAAGLLGALTWCVASGASHLILLAVDLPKISKESLLDLIRGVRPGAGVVPRSGHWLEPLCAIYPCAAADPLAKGLAEGRNRLQDLVGHLVEERLMVERVLSPAEELSFFNLNTPGDLSSLQLAP